MEQNSLSYLWQLNDLLHSIAEGFEYYIEHVSYESIKNDLLASVKKAAECLQCLDGSETTRFLNNILSEDREQAIISGENWFDKIYTILFAKINMSLKESKENKKNLYKALFQHMQNSPVKNNAYYNLMLESCLDGGMFAPEAAYHAMINMLREQPALLNNPQNAHPEYIFIDSPQRTFEECPVCGDHGTPYYMAFSYLMSDFGHPHLPVKLWMKCECCNNLYTFQFPEEIFHPSAKIQMIYPDAMAYTLLPVNGLELPIWGEVLTRLMQYTPGRKLLEVGIGNGGLIAVAQELGLEIHAAELSYSAAKSVSDALNISIWNGDFLQYPEEEQYSIITMGDVIEHVTNPRKALEKARKLLKKDGVLWLSTPNYDSSFSKMRKYQDAMWNEPWHITYFNYKGLKNLWEGCGFKLAEYKVSNRYNGSMELILEPSV